MLFFCSVVLCAPFFSFSQFIISFLLSSRSRTLKCTLCAGAQSVCAPTTRRGTFILLNAYKYIGCDLLLLFLYLPPSITLYSFSRFTYVCLCVVVIFLSLSLLLFAFLWYVYVLCVHVCVYACVCFVCCCYLCYVAHSLVCLRQMRN